MSGQAPQGRQSIILLNGHPSTGKSTSAQRLFFEFTPHRRVSLLTTLSVRLSLGEMKDLHDERARAQVYDRLAALAEEKLRARDEIVILDGNYARRPRRSTIYELGSRYGADVYLLECVVDDDTAIRPRLAFRQKRTDDPQHLASTMDLYQLIKQSSDPIAEDRLPDGRPPVIVQYSTDAGAVRVGGAAALGLDEAQQRLVAQVVEALHPSPVREARDGSPADIRAVIFDIGGVIQPLRWDCVVARAKALAPDMTVDAFRNAFYSQREEYFGRYETAHLSAHAFWGMVGAKLGIGPDGIDALSTAFEQLYAGVDEDVMALIERLGSRVRLYTLSNSCPELERATLTQGGCYRHFDQMYFSHRIGVRKPLAEAYRHVLAETGLAAGQCVFVDDAPANVAAASALGMRAILYVSPAQLERDLAEHLGSAAAPDPAQ